MIDRIIYINLEKSINRNNYMINLLNDIGIKYERYNAKKITENKLINGKYRFIYDKLLDYDVDNNLIDNWLKEKLLNGNSYDKKKILGALGCYISHYSIIKKFTKHKIKQKYLLILEDDVKIDKNIISAVNLFIKENNDFDIIRIIWEYYESDTDYKKVYYQKIKN